MKSIQTTQTMTSPARSHKGQGSYHFLTGTGTGMTGLTCIAQLSAVGGSV